MPVEELLREEPPQEEYSAVAVMTHIAWAQDPGLWDHPLAQEFLQQEMCGESEEFLKFRAWLSTKPRWTPLRLEWSIYNEDLKAGAWGEAAAFAGRHPGPFARPCGVLFRVRLAGARASTPAP